MEVTKLNATQLQCSEDEVTAGEECMQLAENVECITNDVVQIIANALNVYASCNSDKVKFKILLKVLEVYFMCSKKIFPKVYSLLDFNGSFIYYPIAP